MIKIIITAALLLSLTSCDDTLKTEKRMTVGNVPTQCLDGVTYYMFSEGGGSKYSGFGYMSAKWDSDGTLDLCTGAY